MRNNLDKTFARLKKKRKKAFIAYLTGGYPSFSEVTSYIQALQEAGVSLIEIGVPFSDPVADGPTIQYSSQVSLERGTSLLKILSWLKNLKQTISVPIVLMSYLNPIWKMGIKNFAKLAKTAGVSGVIIPDLIPEESIDIERLFRKNKIHLSYLLAPTTPSQRQKFIAKRTGGFLYAVSVTGVTGARKVFLPETKKWLTSLTRMSSKPVCVGFGISGPEQIKELRSSVDGFIVGSAIIDLIRKNSGMSRKNKLKHFAENLVKEC